MEYTIVIANRNGAKSSKLITVAYIHMVECKIYLLYSQLGSDPETIKSVYFCKTIRLDKLRSH